MVNEFISALSNSFIGNWALIFSLIFSLVCCFNGYKLFKVLIKFYGFIIFTIIGIVLGSTLGFNSTYLTIFSTALGIIGILLSYKFYRGMVIFTVMYQAFLVISLLIPSIVIAILISALVGILSSYAIKPVIAITTATSSSLVIASIVAVLLPLFIPFQFFIAIVFAILGIVKQLK